MSQWCLKSLTILPVQVSDPGFSSQFPAQPLENSCCSLAPGFVAASALWSSDCHIPMAPFSPCIPTHLLRIKPKASFYRPWRCFTSVRQEVPSHLGAVGINGSKKMWIRSERHFSEWMCVSPACGECALKAMEINKLSPSNSFFLSRDVSNPWMAHVAQWFPDLSLQLFAGVMAWCSHHCWRSSVVKLHFPVLLSSSCSHWA